MKNLRTKATLFILFIILLVGAMYCVPFMQTQDGIPLANAQEAGYEASYEGGYESSYEGGYEASYEGGYEASYEGGYEASYEGGYEGGYEASYEGGYEASYEDAYESAYESTYESTYQGTYEASYAPPPSPPEVTNNGAPNAGNVAQNVLNNGGSPEEAAAAAAAYLAGLGYSSTVTQNSDGSYTVTCDNGGTVNVPGTPPPPAEAGYGPGEASYESSYEGSYESGYEAQYEAGYEAQYEGSYESGYEAEYEASYGPAESSYQGSYEASYQGGYEAAYQGSYEAGYEAAYQSGYEAGYQSGYEASYEGSYESGYEASYQASYESGYEASYEGSYQSGYESAYESQYQSGYEAQYEGSYESGYESEYQSSYQSSYQPPFSPAMCKCDGLKATALVPGGEVVVTSYGKVTGEDVRMAEIKGIKFFFGKGDHASATILSQSGSPISARVIASQPDLVKYQADWKFTMPTDVDPNAIYHIWSNVSCQKKQQSAQVYSPQNVLAATDQAKKEPNIFQRFWNFITGIFGGGNSQTVTNSQFVQSSPTPNQNPNNQLQLGTFTPAELIESGCTMMKFQFKDQ